MEKGSVLKELEKQWGEWPSPVVARSEVERFTGGLICRRTMANLDSEGKGPSEKVNLGRSVGYSKQSLISWLGKRLQIAAKK